MYTNKDIKYIANLLRIKMTVQLDLDRQREGLYGIYSDIVSILHKQGGGKEALLYKYEHTLTQEENFYNLQAAYEAGFNSTFVNQERGLMNYLCAVYVTPANQEIIKRRDRLFYKLCSLLGEADGLIVEFTELFRACNGIISNQIFQFYQLGYAERGTAQ